MDQIRAIGVFEIYSAALTQIPYLWERLLYFLYLDDNLQSVDDFQLLRDDSLSSLIRIMYESVWALTISNKDGRHRIIGAHSMDLALDTTINIEYVSSNWSIQSHDSWNVTVLVTDVQVITS